MKNKILNLKKRFQEFCKLNKFEKNDKQIEVIVLLEKFLKQKTKSLFLLKKKDFKTCFYLHGKVGVGKTMLINFAYENIKMKKMKIHFNEFMIKFHDFKHKKKKEKTILKFVKELKKKI